MKKRIISLLTAFVMTVCAIPAISAGAASEFTLQNDSKGNVFVSRYNGKGGTVNIPSNVSYIGDSAFKGNTKITKVVFPSKCTGINRSAFENCVNLKTAVFSSNSMNIGESAFSNCTSLMELDFQDSGMSIGSIDKKAFMNCFALTNVVLPSNTKDIGAFAFGNCISLESITVPYAASVGRNAIGMMYDEKTEDYIRADGKSQAYITYYELYKGKLMDWYEPQTGKEVTVNVVKGSDGERYAKEYGLKSSYYKKIETPNPHVERSTEDSIIIKWNKINNVDAYRVSILKNGKYESYTVTSSNKCTVSGLESGKEYTFKVTSLKRGAGNKYTDLSSSRPVTAATAAKAAQTSAPKVNKINLSAQEITENSINLKWNSVTDADAYRVSILKNGKYESYTITVSIKCTVKGLESGKDYKFKVTALKKINNSKYSDIVSSAELAVTTAAKRKSEAFTVPEGPKVTAEASKDSVKLRWNGVKNAEAYQVNIYNESTKKYEKYAVVTGKSCTVNGLKSGTKYKFQVVSLFKMNNKYTAGNASKDIVISTAGVVNA